MIRLPKHPLRVLLLACALLVAVAAPAAPAAVAETPCWKKLLNDWYDGRIDNVYPIPCYQAAINQLPTDIELYSTARDDIDRALQAAIRQGKQPATPAKTVATSTPAAPTPATTTPATTTPVKTTPTKTRTTDTTQATSTLPGRPPKQGPIPTAIDSSSKGGATSFPLPLLILGGLALLLLAAGAVGLIVRRMQDRGGPPPAT